MSSPEEKQRKADAQHLKLLWVFHYVMAGYALLGIGFLILHHFMFTTMFADPEAWGNAKQPAPPQSFIEIFRVFYYVMGFLMIAHLLLNLVSAWCIQHRKFWPLSLFVAAVNCISFPIGTTLGVSLSSSFCGSP